MKHTEECKREAKERKLYLFSFTLDGRHVPQVLLTKKVGGGTKMEFAGALTRKQYEKFIHFYLTVLSEAGCDEGQHDQYIRRMEARAKREARRK